MTITALEKKMALVAGLRQHLTQGDPHQAIAYAGGIFVGVCLEAGLTMGQAEDLFQDMWIAARNAGLDHG